MVLALFSLYLAIINIAAFAMFGTDKAAARKNRRRIPEKRLFLVSAAGGSLGALIGMRVWHHKTKHASFAIGIPLLLLINMAIGALIVKSLY